MSNYDFIDGDLPEKRAENQRREEMDLGSYPELQDRALVFVRDDGDIEDESIGGPPRGEEEHYSSNTNRGEDSGEEPDNPAAAGGFFQRVRERLFW